MRAFVRAYVHLYVRACPATQRRRFPTETTIDTHADIYDMYDVPARPVDPNSRPWERDSDDRHRFRRFS